MKTVFLNIFFVVFWPYPKNGKIRFRGSAALGGLRCWKVKGKTVRGETGLYRCYLSSSLPAVAQAPWGTLPSDPHVPHSPVHFPLVSSFVYWPPISWVTEASLETLPLPRSILLPPCRWDTFPDFFPQSRVRESLLLVTENIPSQMLKE